jgi:alpha-methylacyl-CoA racemase
MNDSAKSVPVPSNALPLSGTVVVDATRMLPGAVLARLLLDLGARVIKVEDPRGGDLLRALPPYVGEMGAGFATFYRGAESLALDLRASESRDVVHALAARADIFIESFRPGTLARWGIELPALRELNARLITCSLPAYGGPNTDAIGHDINFVGESGLLSMLPEERVPRLQIADVSSALLASSALVAALLSRVTSGRGMHVEQPLAMGPVPFMTWAWSELACGTLGVIDSQLSGECAAYRLYECADRERVALGALEPKLWVAFCEMTGLQQYGGDGLRRDGEGVAAVVAASARLRERPRAEWLAAAAANGVPLTSVNSPADGMRSQYYARRGGAESTWLDASLTARPERPAPALGEGNERWLAELGL